MLAICRVGMFCTQNGARCIACCATSLAILGTAEPAAVVAIVIIAFVRCSVSCLFKLSMHVGRDGGDGARTEAIAATRLRWGSGENQKAVFDP